MTITSTVRWRARPLRGNPADPARPPDQTSLQGLREVLREVAVLGSYRHERLVPLLSFCLSHQGDRQEACLVYPLMARGDLEQALAQNDTMQRCCV
jgi:hypothetical protein